MNPFAYGPSLPYCFGGGGCTAGVAKVKETLRTSNMLTSTWDLIATLGVRQQDLNVSPFRTSVLHPLLRCVPFIVSDGGLWSMTRARHGYLGRDSTKNVQ